MCHDGHMITRIGVTVDSVDVDLLDRLATLQGLNRSQQLREFLEQARPMIKQTVETLEAAMRNRDQLLDAIARSELTALQALLPEVEKIDAAVLGAMSRFEGAMTADQAKLTDEDLIQAFGKAAGVEVPPASDPRSSNHGGQVSTPEEKGSTE